MKANQQTKPITVKTLDSLLIFLNRRVPARLVRVLFVYGKNYAFKLNGANIQLTNCHG